MSPNVQSALDDLITAIRSELRAEFLSALGGGGDIPTPFRKRGPGRPKTAAAKPRKKGGKRTPEELEAMTKNLLAAIKKTPGQRIEQLATGLGASTKELALPTLKLFEAKAISSKGQRRGTTYFAK
jgi:hypothetical protein